jgi:hypothetical protein
VGGVGQKCELDFSQKPSCSHTSKLLEEIISVLDSIHRRTVLSEAFSIAIPFTVSKKAPSSTDVSAPINVPVSSATIPLANVPSSPTVSLATTVTPSTNVPPSTNYSQPSKAYRSNAGISEATVLKLQQPEPGEHQNIRSFLQTVEKQEVNFWNPNIQQYVTKEEARLLHIPSNYGVYLCLVLEATEIHHKILQRFARVLVYELSLQGHTAVSLAQSFQGVTLFRSKDTLEKQIESYIGAGNRYAHIAQKLGGLASLFFLPHNIGNSL